MKLATSLLVLAMSVTFYLLAMQAEIVTAVLGYIFGTLLVLAFISTFFKKSE